MERGGRDRENGPRGSRSAMASSYGGRTILSEVLMWTVSFGQTIDGPRGGRSVGENTADASRGGRSTAESSTIVKRERRRGNPMEVTVDIENVDKKLTNSSRVQSCN